jgi:hypothetical protein
VVYRVTPWCLRLTPRMVRRAHAVALAAPHTTPRVVDKPPAPRMRAAYLAAQLAKPEAGTPPRSLLYLLECLAS